jgi:hypothetical protein
MTVDSAAFQRAQTNGTALVEGPDVMRAELAEMLALSEIDRTIVDVQMFGHGPTASVDLQLSGDVKLTFERFSDITKPPTLTAYLASVGVARTFKGTEAALAGALISRLAEHHASADVDEVVREWGSEFLRLAAVQEVTLDEQAERWRAFSSLQGLNPARDAGEDRTAFSLAQASVVLLDATSGVRLVRCGWFLAFVRRETGTYSAATLDTQMARVGWLRSGSEGKVKATAPDGRRTLNWRFYTVPNGWEQR